MTVFGVTPAGLVIKPVSELVTEIQTEILGTIDPKLDLDPDDPLGQLVGIMGEKLGELWELLPVAYNATNRGDAEGALLDNVGALTGVGRLPASPSSVYCQIKLSVAGTYAIGALVAYVTPVPTVQFANAVAVTAPSTVGGSPISSGNPYVVTVLFKSPNNGPDAANALITANAAASVTPTPVSPGTLLSPVPVTGWSGVGAVGDVAGPTLGTLVETDAAYRVTQVAELGANGAATPDSTAASILKALSGALTPVVGATCRVYENTTLATDSNGLPGKSFMAVVFDGLSPNTAQNNPLIAQAVWKNKPSGMQSYGATSFTVLDSQGAQRVVYFSRPTAITAYLSITVAISPRANPTAVQAAVIAAIVAASQGQPFTVYGTSVTPDANAPTTLAPGQDVILDAFRAIAQGQAGVIDVPQCTLGTAPSPAGTANIQIGEAQVGVLTSSTVVVVPVVFVP